MQGTVIFFSPTRRFGFIAPSDGSRDVFVHQSEVQGFGELQGGDKVEFEVVHAAKGPEARNVRVIE